MRRDVRTLTRRATWGLADQALTSVSSLLLAVIVARSASASELGALGVLLAAYLLTLVVARAFCGEPLLLGLERHAAQAAASNTTISAAAGAAVLVGVMFAVPVYAAGLLFGGAVATASGVLALALPFLFLHDVYRLWFFSLEMPAKAATVDGLWLTLQAFAFYLLTKADVHSLNELLLAWGISVAVASLLGRLMTKQPIRLRLGRDFLRRHAVEGRLLAADSLLALGPTQVALIVVAAVVALDVAGVIRAGLIVLGPVSVVAQSASYSFIPPLRRLLQGDKSITAACAAVSLVMAVIATVWAGLVSTSPAWLEHVLGRAVTTAQPALLPLSLYLVFNVASLGPLLGLRGMLALKDALWVRGLLSPLTITAPVVGGMLSGAWGAGWGCAIGGATTFVACCVSYRRALLRRGAGQAR